MLISLILNQFFGENEKINWLNNFSAIFLGGDFLSDFLSDLRL